MSEETTQPSQANKPCNDVAKKTKSKFWLGFLCGVPIYPLVIPWVLLLIPDRLSQAYLEFYAVYVNMILNVINGG